MAISFPRAADDWFDITALTTTKFKLVPQQNVSGTTGDIWASDIGPQYWEADIRFVDMDNDIAGRVQSIIESLDGSLNSFYWYDPRWQFPRSDPDGSLLAASTVKIAALPTNNKLMALKGLPAGFNIRNRDMLCFDFGTSPVHRALHRVADGSAADGTGLTGNIEVRPYIRPGAAVNAVVTLIRPTCEMLMIPDSFDEGTAKQMITSGMGFKARQRV